MSNVYKVLGVILCSFTVWTGVRAVVQRRIVLRPSRSRSPDEEHAYVGRDAVFIGLALIALALLVGYSWLFG